MTMEEIRKSNKDVLIADDIAKVVGMNSMKIKAAARNNPGRLGFSVIVAEDTVRIPRKAFIHYMDYGNAVVSVNAEGKA